MAVDYGTDVSATTDLPRRDALVSGPRNLGEALVRRLSTRRGALARIGESADYGLDVRDMIHQALTDADRGAWENDIARECEKDERVQLAIAKVEYTEATGSASITIDIVPVGENQRLTYVLQVTALTVSLLTTPTT